VVSIKRKALAAKRGLLLYLLVWMVGTAPFTELIELYLSLYEFLVFA